MAAAIVCAGVCEAAEVREERLDNGLRILLKRVEGMPIVSVWSWVRAGSANERPGITGAAHWCEHMNFKGTVRYGREDLKNLLEREGGVWNGFTWLDQTAYYETLPSMGLHLALDIETQRMTSSLFLPKAVESERRVIISELQMGENDPENLLDIETNAAAFKAHPYQWPTIGWQSDIEGMARDDLYGFYRRYYTPNNTTVVVTGDFQEVEALEMIREKFGPIPKGPELGRLHTREPKQEGERRVSVEREGATAYLELLYHTPTVDSADFVPLLALNTLLGGAESMNLSSVEWRGPASKSSRLHRGLVDTKLAAKAGSIFLPTKYPGVFCVYATAAQGIELTRLEKGVLDVIERVKAGEITDAEFQKVLNQMRARLVYDSDSITGEANMLGFFDTVCDYKYAGTLLPRIGGLKKEEIATAARSYFTEENRTVGWYVPVAARVGMPPDVGDSAGSPGARPARFREMAGNQSPKSGGGKGLWEKKAAAGAPQTIRLNAIKKEFPNGLTLVVRENALSPSVVADVDIAAGSAYDPSDKPGLANLTAAMLDHGSTGMSAQLIAEVLDASGTEMEITCGRDRAAVVAQMLKEKFPLVMEVLAQMLMHPVFPDSELEKLRGQVITTLEEDAQDTQEASVDGAYEGIFPAGHPYQHKVEGDPASVRAIRRGDVAGFYRTRYGPRQTTIVISGDVSAKEAEAVVGKLFGDWKSKYPPISLTVLPPPLPLETSVRKIRIPGKTQTDIAVGFRGISRDNPDYYALYVMNTILGRFGMGGRLGRSIREDKGLAYYISSAFVPYRHEGPFLARAGVAPGNITAALDGIQEVVRGMMKSGPTSQELQESKANIIRSLPRQLETNRAVVAALADAQFYNLGLDYFERLPKLIDKVSAKEVRRVAREYLHPDTAVVVLAGPVE
jgi:zinc protease